jgi:hypothetical protein
MTVDQLASLALALALAWASGIRLYAVLFVVGLASHFAWLGWSLPESLKLLEHPLVLGANAILLSVEFLADKVPGVDSLWDAVHTFVRIPAGALLAAGVLADGDSAAWTLAAGLLGGSVAAGTHFLKAGGRIAINTSPEPVSNWVASFTEDALVLGGLWLAFTQPIVFIALLALFVLLVIWLIPKLWRLGRQLLRRLTNASPEGAKLA